MGRMLGGVRGRSRADGRVLATVLFTDIVGSTELAARLGDRRWRELLARHHALVRGELRRFGGREIDTAGDGFFTLFDGPAQAVRCAAAIVEAVRAIGLDVRAGVHVGEVEVTGRSVGGIAVHIGARIAGLAGAGEVLVSSTVHELVVGSDLKFTDRGLHALKGVPGQWRAFALEMTPAADVAPVAVPVRPAHAGIPRGLLAAALAALAILVAAAALLAARPGVEPTRAGPNTVAALDPTSDRLGRATAVGAGPTRIVVAGNALWVANSGDRTVSRVELGSGREVARPGGVGVPGALAAADGRIFVADTFAGTLTAIDTRTNAVADSVNVRGRAMVVAFGALWLTDHVTGTVAIVNPRTLAIDARVQLPPGSDPGAIVATDDAIWVADRAALALRRIDPGTRGLTATVQLCCRPASLVTALGSIWITSADRDRVLRVDPAAGQILRSIDVADGPDAIAGDERGVWVAHPAARVIWRLDARGDPQAMIDVDGEPAGLAVGPDAVWVAIGGG